MAGIDVLTLDPYLTDVLMRDLVGHDRRPVAFLVYLWLTAEQEKTEQEKTEQQKTEQEKTAQEKTAQEKQRRPVPVSYQEMAESIGISKSSAQSSVAWLMQRGLLSMKKANVTATPEYTVLKPWRRSKS